MNKTKTQNKERPIIFNSEMVKAILDGRKTQTRRVIKPQPNNMDDERRKKVVLYDGWRKWGLEGDRLWVREAWSVRGWNREAVYVHYFSDAHNEERIVRDFHISQLNIEEELWFAKGIKKKNPFRKRPSIFMPRWASRITLEITDIRVERLQDIDEIDAVQEGVFVDSLHDLKSLMYPYKEHFKYLWDFINAKRGYGWDSNPFVWCISFKKLD